MPARSRHPSKGRTTSGASTSRCPCPFATLFRDRASWRDCEPGELLAIEWGDVDVEARRDHRPAPRTRNGRVGPPQERQGAHRANRSSRWRRSIRDVGGTAVHRRQGAASSSRTRRRRAGTPRATLPGFVKHSHHVWKAAARRPQTLRAAREADALRVHAAQLYAAQFVLGRRVPERPPPCSSGQLVDARRVESGTPPSGSGHCCVPRRCRTLSSRSFPAREARWCTHGVPSRAGYRWVHDGVQQPFWKTESQTDSICTDQQFDSGP
jgi:hypothetical protein